MKRLIATSLLVGYVMLVPFCFFGASLMTSPDSMNMISNPAHQMSDCGILVGACANSTTAGGVDDASHHVGMYHSITQSPLVAFSIVLVALIAVVLFTFGLSRNLFTAFLSRIILRFKAQRLREISNSIRTAILTWLSLFETSPNFA